MQGPQQLFWINFRKALIILFSGALAFTLIISIFPLIGSLFLDNFPIGRVLKENFSLLIPLSVFCICIAPLLSFIATIFRYNRIRWLLVIGILGYWVAVFLVMLFMSNFYLVYESFINVLILSIWGILAYSFFSLPILIPAIILFEKWSGSSIYTGNFLLQKNVGHSERNLRSLNSAPNKFILFLSKYLFKKYRNASFNILCPKKGDVILEIGFGQGFSLFSIAECVGNSGKVTGIDISPEMCRIVGSKIRTSGLSDRIDILCQDILKYKFSETEFNAVFVCFSLEYFSHDEISVLLDESYRVLKEDGRLVVAGISNIKGNNVVLLYEFLHSVFPRIIRSKPIDITKSIEDSKFEIEGKEDYTFLGLPVVLIKATKKTTEILHLE